MAKSTFLQLVQKLHRECSLSGAVPSSVVSQVGMAAQLVRWVADADYEIQSLWADWRFLWTEWSESTIASTRDYTAPAAAGTWDETKFWLGYGTASAQRMQMMQYDAWKASYGSGVQTEGKPTHVVVLPSNNLRLYPTPNAVYSLSGEYWKLPTLLAANSDTSNIPEQYEMAIIFRAKIKFAEDQGDEVLLMNAQNDALTWLTRLEMSQLPGNERNRFGSPEELVVVPV